MMGAELIVVDVRTYYMWLLLAGVAGFLLGMLAHRIIAEYHN